jgi:hypothetical protein
MGKPGPNNMRFQRLYNIWTLMKKRCYNKNDKRYKDYGGRGIRVDDDWLHDYQKFKDWAYANGYQDNLTIERIDNNKGYSPDNCKWIPKEDQALNRRMNYFFTYRNKTQCLSQWCRELGLYEHYPTIKRRIIELGMPFEEAINMPIKDTSPKNIAGLHFGKWTAISFSQKKRGHIYWLCKCECGRLLDVRKDHLVNGRTFSCNHCKSK